MTTVYTRPILKSLMQGSRIAFIRQMRHMTQEELGQAIGLKGDNTRRLICRHEKHNRSPKEPKLPFDSNDTQRCLAKRCKEWKKMQRKYRNNEISYEEYWDWKMKQGDADYE